MQLEVSRNMVGGTSYAPPKKEHFDLCSTDCEAAAVGKMLARLVPEVKAVPDCLICKGKGTYIAGNTVAPCVCVKGQSL